MSSCQRPYPMEKEATTSKRTLCFSDLSDYRKKQQTLIFSLECTTGGKGSKKNILGTGVFFMDTFVNEEEKKDEDKVRAHTHPSRHSFARPLTSAAVPSEEIVPLALYFSRVPFGLSSTLVRA